MTADSKGKEMTFIDEGEEGELAAFLRGVKRVPVGAKPPEDEDEEDEKDEDEDEDEDEDKKKS